MSGLIIVRALNLACGAVALGIPAILALAVLPSVAWGERNAAERITSLLRNLTRLVWAAVGVGFVTGILWLVFQAAAMSGRTFGGSATAEILGLTLSQTYFGNVLLVRLVLSGVVAFCIARVAPAQSGRSRIGWVSAAAAVAAVAFAALAWAGHAVATPGALHLIADVGHLLAAGVWLGGLLVLVALFGAARHRADAGWVAIIAGATRRFSLVGVVCVGTLLVSGLVNSWFLVGTLAALVGTDYGHLLLVKLALFGLMIGLAAVNRFRLSPRLDDRASARAMPAVLALRRNAVAEAVLGFLVVGIVSTLGAVPPALHDQPWWPFPWRPSLEAMALPAVYNEIVVATAMVVTGVALFILGIVRHRYRLVAIPFGLGLIACFVPSFFQLRVAAYPTTFAHSPAAYTTQSIARGSRLFAENCAECHGARGKGNGPAASSLKVPPADLTAAHVLDHSEGDLFWWLSAGVPESAMPGFAETLSDNERWDLVNWVRTLPIGGLDEGLVTEVGGGLAPRAPDFTFETADGEEGSLQNLLNEGPLLLVLFTPAKSEPRLRRLAAAEKTLSDAGLGILALSLGDESGTASEPAARFVARADASVAATYRVIATAPNYPALVRASHLEFLIDRNGYVRALWLPEETVAWDDVATLVQLVRQLAKRPLAPAGASAHMHMQ